MRPWKPIYERMHIAIICRDYVTAKANIYTNWRVHSEEHIFGWIRMED